jgi:ER-bound oxygenase mpaB/B'/Rubber oxygenase, catalytic domain
MAGGSSRWTDALLDSMREKGDPVADDPVADVFKRGGVGAVNNILRTLVRVDQPVPDDLPPELKNYLVDTLPMPEWADMAKIKRGQQLFETWGVLIVLCLFCASLPSSYAAAKGVKVLYLTARLETDARRRVMETGQFLMDVLTVGGLDDEGKGRRTIQRVRLMHAAVRHLIKARASWNPGWGKPINQEDLAGTLLAFSAVVVEPMVRLGVSVSPKNVDAYIHLWNVIGHLLGVRDEMLVRDADDAIALVDAIRRRQFEASPEGQEMTKALMKLLDELTPSYEFDDTIPPLIRHLIGDETADMLDVPKSRLGGCIRELTRVANWFFVGVFGPTGQTKRDSERDKLVSDLARPFGHELVDGLFKLERGGERAPFDLPDHLARRWDIVRT